eukprot:TRINITY_DN12634_c0_g1_i1.p1 TRINITY_DN12634_c0_g1~~TRINITY_DN12634_c0_g1_i1.p1  ORF type:complete len:316 (-),score=47.23 TRINITY_DN12634_c0_g1_i1:18-965(-)
MNDLIYRLERTANIQPNDLEQLYKDVYSLLPDSNDYPPYPSEHLSITITNNPEHHHVLPTQVANWLDHWWDNVVSASWQELFWTVFTEDEEFSSVQKNGLALIEGLIQGLASDNLINITLSPQQDLNYLLRLGLFRPLSTRQTWRFLFVHKRRQWEDLKSVIRSEHHRIVRQTQEDRMRLLLESVAENNLPFPSPSQGQRAVREFVKKYVGFVGCHPFLLGLLELMRKQRGSDNIWRWEIDNVVISHAAPSPFETDAIRFLRFLRLNLVQKTGHISVWEIDFATSDEFTSEVARSFPKKLYGRATGRIFPNGLRT